MDARVLKLEAQNGHIHVYIDSSCKAVGVNIALEVIGETVTFDIFILAPNLDSECGSWETRNTSCCSQRDHSGGLEHFLFGTVSSSGVSLDRSTTGLRI